MQVLQLWSDRHRETSIDIFVHEPFPFEDEYAKALIKPLYGAIDVRFVSIHALISMKEAAGREQNRIDIEHLRNNELSSSEFDWRVTSFEGARREQLRRWARLPLEHILLAIEEMQDITHALGTAPDRYKDTVLEQRRKSNKVPAGAPCSSTEYRSCCRRDG